jgi:hypothetical protein
MCDEDNPLTYEVNRQSLMPLRLNSEILLIGSVSSYVWYATSERRGDVIVQRPRGEPIDFAVPETAGIRSAEPGDLNQQCKYDLMYTDL